MESYSKIVHKLRQGFDNGVLKSIDSRKHVLLKIKSILVEHEDDIVEAIHKDMGRCRFECIIGDIDSCKSELGSILKNLDLWLKDKSIPRSFLTLMDSVSVQIQPLGVFLIISPWNFPFFLSISPLIGAIAAGNCVLLKPSEFAPASASLLFELISKYIDKNVCQVVCGDHNVSKTLLEVEKFDHIMFTGGPSVGREVYVAAAKKLTPVTLELGGKCPVYVDQNTYLSMTVKRIISSKLLNTGQLCVAPDYILCHQNIVSNFTKMLIEVFKEYLGENPQGNPDYGRIVNARHFNRISELLKTTNGKIIYGGDKCADDNYFAMTVVNNLDKDDVLMQDELFAPILPILTVDSPTEAIKFIRSKSKPLGIYVFTNDVKVFEQFKTDTSSGAIIQNDCSIHPIIHELPFGGVGMSGIGSYHGVHSINEFSHHRSVILKSTTEMINNRARYPPYNESKLSMFRWGMKTDGKNYCQIL